MRLRGLMMLGVLTMGTVGCGDAVGPPVGEGRDLEFVVPEARYGSPEESELPARAGEITLEMRSSMEAALLEEGDEAMPALLFDAWVSGSWQGSDLFVNYGLTGLGTGYTMTPTIHLAERGGVPRRIESSGQSEDQPVWWYQHPYNEERFPTSSHCGNTADARATFQVRSRGVLFGQQYYFENNTTRSTSVAQAACPWTPSGGGTMRSTTVESGDSIYLCFYEVWVDSNGAVVQVVFLGCEPYRGNAS